MKLIMGIWIFLTLQLITVTLTTSESVSSCNIDEVRKIIDTLEESLNYFKNYSSQLNIDSIFIVRVVKDQLGVIQTKRNLYDDPDVQEELTEKIQNIQKICQDIITVALPAIKENYLNYYAKMGKMIDSPDLFAFSYDRRKVDLSQIKSKVTCKEQGGMLGGGKSDTCILQVLESCEITDECFTAATQDGFTGYFITMQMFILQLAAALNCPLPVDNEEYQDIRDNLCSNIFKDGEEIAARGFDPEEQDLFMQQITFCSLWGYEDFTRSDWINAVISWKQPSNCYNDPITYRCQDEPRTGKRRRRKRYTKVLPEGCTSHATSMAIGALSAMLHFCAFE